MFISQNQKLEWRSNTLQSHMYRIEDGHICAAMCVWVGGALLNSEAWEWSRVLLFHHRRPQGSCNKRGRTRCGRSPCTPLLFPALVFFFVFILYSSPSSLFLAPFLTFSFGWWKFFSSQYWEILPVQQKHDGMLSEEPQAKLKSAWSMIFFFFFFSLDHISQSLLYLCCSKAQQKWSNDTF